MGASSSSRSSLPSTDAVEVLRRNRVLSSNLYFDVPLSRVPVIYSPSYDIAFLGIEKLHPFDSSKWGRVYRFLTNEGVLDKNKIVEPLEASKDDLSVVHSESYLDSLKSSLRVAAIMEVPPVATLPNCLVQRKVLHPFRLQVGGSILSAKLAIERGWAINIGGGFHHCSAEKGGGFCAYADITLCIQYAFYRLNISRVMIIDLDAHQGNGHETDFYDDRRVYILDMYNAQIYPLVVSTTVSIILAAAVATFLGVRAVRTLQHADWPSQDFEARRYIDQKIELLSGTRTKEYLELLDKALEVARNMFDPELVVYNAGTDVLEGDPLGMLKINPDGVVTRDEMVFRFARDNNTPIVMLTSGGYTKSSARVIADSIINLSRNKLIDLNSIS